MNWNIFSAWFKNKENRPVLDKGLDRRLIKSVRKQLFPGWSQLKYLKHFLNSTEKKLLAILSGLVVVALIGVVVSLLVNNVISTPKRGGEFTEAMIGQPKYINPLFSSTNDIDSDLVSLIYSGLFKIDKAQKLAPDLAASYTIDAEQKVYEIELKENIVWSDGDPFSASDVLYTFETIQNPEVGSPLFAAFQGVLVEKINENKIRFTLPEPFTNFLNSLTVGILPEHVWALVPATGMKLAKHNIQPIATGPWMFNRLTKDDLGNIQSYSLTYNDRYWGESPYLKDLSFKFFGDFAPAVEALRSGSVMALSFIPNQYRERLHSKKLINYNINLPQYTALFFNQQKQEALKDSDLREALSLAINKKELINTALNGQGQAIASPLLLTKANSPAPDLEAANQLIDKSWDRIEPEAYFELQKEIVIKEREKEINELKESASSTPEILKERLDQIENEIGENIRKQMNPDQIFYRKNKDNEILQLIISTSDTSELARTAEIIAERWQDLGIKTNVETVPNYQISRETIRTHNYQVLLYGVIVGSDPDPYPFWHSSQRNHPGLNLSLYSNRTADKIIDDARATNDPAKRAELYKQLQDLLEKDKPAIFLYTPTYTFTASKDLKGINLGTVISPSDRYKNLASWYINTKWRWK